MFFFWFFFLFSFHKGVSVYWLGDFVFVESGLGVRVKFDLTNTVYVTVTAEHKSATRGLCGVYNGNADGEQRARQLHCPILCLTDANDQQFPSGFLYCS